RGKKASTSAKKVLSVRRGNGRLTLSWSVNVPDSKHSKRLPAVSARKIVPYLLKVRDKIMSNWNNPYIGKPLAQKEKRVVIYVTINRNGKLDEINVERFSPDMAFNRSAISAIYSSEPFDPIPPSINLDKVRVKVNFEVKYTLRRFTFFEGLGENPSRRSCIPCKAGFSVYCCLLARQDVPFAFCLSALRI
ncbi:MAG: hypothetical protein DSY35_03780, partial [Desulfurobacterium sp.]